MPAKAKFEQELATTKFVFDPTDNLDWEAAYEAVELATAKADEEIRTRLAELGFPRELLSWKSEDWLDRLKGFRHVSYRELEYRCGYRDDVRCKAFSKIDEMHRKAIDLIELASAEVMPTADQLIPVITVEEAQRLLRPGVSAELEASAEYYASDEIPF